METMSFQKRGVNIMKKTLLKLTVAGVLALTSMTFAQAATSVGKEERVLIVLSELDSTGMPELEPLYSALEDLTNHFVRAILQDKYKSIHMLNNNLATLSTFKRVVYDRAMDPEVRAIDVIISVHGSPTRLALKEATYSKEGFRDQMLATTNRREQINKIFVKKKLRALYNLACYAGRNMNFMKDIGFGVVNGAKGVNANSEVELVPALTAWANGVGFKNSFAASNNPIALAISDTPVIQAGRLGNNALADTNSEKVFSGLINMTINSPAAE